MRPASISFTSGGSRRRSRPPPTHSTGGRSRPPLESPRCDQLDQRLGDLGVELTPLVRIELVQRRRAAARTVVAVGRDRLERLDDRDDAALARYGVADQSVGIPAPVDPLVVVADP